jgi:Tol biopolymer transport system component
MELSFKSAKVPLLLLFTIAVVLVAGCTAETTPPTNRTVSHQGDWGIYALNPSTEEVELIWSCNETISHLCLNHAGDEFAFSRKTGGTLDSNEEIFTIGVDGTGLRQLTSNNYRDLYPCYSPDDSRMAFLSIGNSADSTLDIYVMNSDGGNRKMLYDSGFHDADIDWGSGGRIAFTRNSQIWTMKDDGSDAQQITTPPKVGQWGNANLPFGDYDPRFSPDGSQIAFERLDDDTSSHGNYNLYVIDSTGTGETKLTETGYSQGLAIWSHSGDRLVYIVAAIGSAGKYDIYMIDSDGSDDRNITPDYFPASFLCHSAVFSKDDSKVYFTGQWYK